MRTTINLDPDVFRAAKQLAAAQATSLSKVVSELARKGLQGPKIAAESRNGFPQFEVNECSPAFSLEDIKREDDES